jgi:hypothetical protein
MVAYGTASFSIKISVASPQLTLHIYGESFNIVACTQCIVAAASEEGRTHPYTVAATAAPSAGSG